MLEMKERLLSTAHLRSGHISHVATAEAAIIVIAAAVISGHFSREVLALFSVRSNGKALSSRAPVCTSRARPLATSRKPAKT